MCVSRVMEEGGGEEKSENEKRKMKEKRGKVERSSLGNFIGKEKNKRKREIKE